MTAIDRVLYREHLPESQFVCYCGDRIKRGDLVSGHLLGDRVVCQTHAMCSENIRSSLPHHEPHFFCPFICRDLNNKLVKLKNQKLAVPIKDQIYWTRDNIAKSCKKVTDYFFGDHLLKPLGNTLNYIAKIPFKLILFRMTIRKSLSLLSNFSLTSSFSNTIRSFSKVYETFVAVALSVNDLMTLLGKENPEVFRKWYTLYASCYLNLSSHLLMVIVNTRTDGTEGEIPSIFPSFKEEGFYLTTTLLALSAFCLYKAGYSAGAAIEIPARTARLYEKIGLGTAAIAICGAWSVGTGDLIPAALIALFSVAGTFNAFRNHQGHQPPFLEPENVNPIELLQ